MKNTIEWIDNLRVFALFFVVILHVSSVGLYQFGNIPMSIWWICNFYDSLSRFCVPIFLMITGALMLSREYQLGYFLKNKFVRIVVPFVFWASVYLSLNLFNKLRAEETSNAFDVFKYLFNEIYASGIYFHFWYVYVIIGIYLFIPILSKWSKDASFNEQLFFLAIWILVTHLALYEKFSLKLDLRYFSGYLGYLVLGHFLYQTTFKNSKIVKKTVLFFLVIGFAIAFLGTFFLTKIHNAYLPDYFHRYLVFDVIMMSIGIFLLFKESKISLKNSFIQKVRNELSQKSFGIYLMHVLVLYFFKMFGLDAFVINPIIAIPLVTILCLFVSWVILNLIEKLPYGKYVVS